MNDDQQQPLPGITLTTGRRALRVSSERQLTVLGSAVVGGGWGSTREILNVHVDDQYDGERPKRTSPPSPPSSASKGPSSGS